MAQHSENIYCISKIEIATITFPEQYELLNKNLQLITKCRHEDKFIHDIYNERMTEKTN